MTNNIIPAKMFMTGTRIAATPAYTSTSVMLWNQTDLFRSLRRAITSPIIAAVISFTNAAKEMAIVSHRAMKNQTFQTLNNFHLIRPRAMIVLQLMQ